MCLPVLLVLWFAGTAAAQASSACDAVTGNLVVNCGFETGSFDPWVKDLIEPYTFVSYFNPHSGDFSLKYGPPTLSMVYQTISTQAGATYRISFWYNTGYYNTGNTYNSTNQLMATFGSTLIFNDTDSAVPYTQIIATVTAEYTETLLSFGISNAHEYTFVDDVVVTVYD